MMRLLKYDWKRNSTTLLGAFAILLIVQIAITVTGSIRDWELGLSLGLSMLAYGSVSVLLLVVSSKTFDYNIKAYHRRLLPVRSVWSVVSSLILACASLLALCLLMALHLWYYWNAAGIPWEMIRFSDYPVMYYVGLALLTAWKFIFLMITIFLPLPWPTASRRKVAYGSAFWCSLYCIMSCPGSASCSSEKRQHGLARWRPFPSRMRRILPYLPHSIR